MPNEPVWKRALREPNAAAWIGLIILVVVIGAATLWFGDKGGYPAEPHEVLTRANH